MSDPHDRFVELAKLCQESFEQRRRYEWRLSLSLWAALGLVAYAAVKEKAKLFGAEWQAWVVSGSLFACYVLYQVTVARAHRIDKAWKHYYMKRAEDHEAESPTEQPAHQWRFLVPQFGITLLVLYLFMRIVLTQ